LLLKFNPNQFKNMQFTSRLAIIPLLFVLIYTGKAQGLRDLMPPGLTIGAAAGATLYNGTDSLYAKVLAREFNEVVPENEFKWYELQPLPGVWDFTKADSLVAFATQNGMRLHGHVLIWHMGLPNWLEFGNFNRTQLLSLMKTHIDTVLRRYKGKFESFDVVNEAFSDQPNGAYRQSMWYNTIGRDYIDSAFVYAHRADSSLKLYYNDYNVEWLNPKSDSMLLRLNQMRQRGVPVHGIGLQGHFVLNLNDGLINSIRQNINRIAQAGYEIRFSEIDIRIPAPTTQAKLITQGRDYANLLRLSLGNSAIKSYTIWGFTDKYSWIPDFFPGFGDGLVFDTNYDPKPAYDSLQMVLQTITGIHDSRATSYSRSKSAYYVNHAQLCDLLSQYNLAWRLTNIQGRLIADYRKGLRRLQSAELPVGWYLLYSDEHPGKAIKILLSQ
jgi:endo-1,4-beta-xylanase